MSALDNEDGFYVVTVSFSGQRTIRLHAECKSDAESMAAEDVRFDIDNVVIDDLHCVKVEA